MEAELTICLDSEPIQLYTYLNSGVSEFTLVMCRKKGGKEEILGMR